MAEFDRSYIQSLSILNYTEEEKKKLCVKNITNWKSYNDVGIPVVNGLCDTGMGSSDNNEICLTCSLNAFDCPGHFGFIKLSLPVYNPVLFLPFISILRGSCFVCHHTYIKKSLIEKITLQLKLLNCGQFQLSTLLDANYSSWVSKLSEKNLNNEKNEEALLSKINRYRLKYLKNSGIISDIKLIAETKILSDERQKLIKKFLRETYSDIRISRCHYCSFYTCRIKAITSSNITVKFAIKNHKDGGGDLIDPSFVKNASVKLDSDSLSKVQYLSIVDVLEHFKLFSANHSEFLHVLCNRPFGFNLVDMFFLHSLCVTPPKFRPISVVGGIKYDHTTTYIYRNIIQNQDSIAQTLQEIHGEEIEQKETDKRFKNFLKGSQDKPVFERLQEYWTRLQICVNTLYDSNTEGSSNKDDITGLRQVLEKKAGLFRMHLMGKRVNHAARSVICPDPMLDIDEIGIPNILASKLTFLEHFSNANTEKLLTYIRNGPDVHPGASYIYSGGSKTLLHPSNKQRNEAVCNKILSDLSSSKDIFVQRHLQNNDVVLMNRQPTLHRPSIMGHRVRVLPKGHVLRIHYASCKSYNADFDGDEMNAHFPQSHLGRSEAYNITSSCHNYLSPRDGKPLTGLIQDYMVSGVLLTIRDRFFTADKFNKIIYSALIKSKQMIVCLPPTIYKPSKLWTGKQLISTLLINCTPSGSIYLNMKGQSKISEKLWPGSVVIDDPNMSEDNILIRNGCLLRGIFDKNQLGSSAYGLIHIFYELYGGEHSNRLLSVLGRACIALLQYSGFSMGIQDVVCTSSSMRKRKKIIIESRNCEEQLLRSVFDHEKNIPLKEQFKRAHLTHETEKLMDLDLEAKNISNEYQNKICSGSYLVKSFPLNSLQLMIQSGSKGTSVNAMQISALLGQVELEGHRPPFMLSGRTLPCFEPYDCSIRSGGFIESNFLLGLSPSEYFFHCMAGREGLVDTAVKTSRSGYLQRCLIKHLEGISVNYDYSARDSDGSIIQFLYGDDGCSVPSLQFSQDNKFEIFSMNHRQLEKSLKPKLALKYLDTSSAVDYTETQHKYLTKKLKKKHDTLKNSKVILRPKTINLHLPTLSIYNPGHYYGSVSDNFFQMILKFSENQQGNSIVDDKHSQFTWQCGQQSFVDLMLLKYTRCLCPPGEAVGVLAAQSIGEPSTQMTLNTFHFAGRGDMNVTLGIPRLRELIMIASENIRTPSVSLKIKNSEHALEFAKKLVIKMNPIPLSSLISSIDVMLKFEKLSTVRLLKYKCSISIKFISKSSLKVLGVKPKSLSKYIENSFIKLLSLEITKKFFLKNQKILILKETSQKTNEPKSHDKEDKSESSGDENPKSLHNSSEEEDDEEEEENIEEENDDFDENKNYLTKLSKDFESNSESFFYDKKNMTCFFELTINLGVERISLISLIQKAVEKAIYNQSPNFKRCFISTKPEGFSMFHIEGNTILDMWKYHDIFEHNSIYSNNVHKMLELYGIEAARTTLIKEIRNVFEVYGITVNYRHLSLLADYMTFHGNYRACNRHGIVSNPSFLQKMTFESTINFLKNACTFGESESLVSPSARLISGLPIKLGTSTFEILTK